MSDQKTNYELAFHINSNLEDSNAVTIKQELEQTITKYGGVVSFARDPERVRLSYPVKDQRASLFGYIQFSAENGGDLLANVQEYIKLNNDILRSLVIKLPSDTQKSQALMRQMKARERLERKAAIPPEPTTPEDEEKLEEQLEEIIKKL